MPYNFVNAYSPQTPIGGALENIAIGLFGGTNPRQKAADDALAAQRRAATEEHEARRLLLTQQAIAAQEKNDEAARGARIRANPVGHFADTVFGPRSQEFQQWRATPIVEGPSMGADEAGATIEGPRPPIANPLPQGIPSKDVGLFDNLHRSAAVADFAQGPDKAGDIAKMMEALRNAGVFADMQAGTADPAKVAPMFGAMKGSPTMDVKDGVSFPVFGGAAPVATPVGQSQINLRGAQAGKESEHGRLFAEQAKTEPVRRSQIGASAAEHVERTTGMREDRAPVTIRNPLAGQPGEPDTIQVKAKDFSAQASQRQYTETQPRPDPAAKPRKIVKLTTAQVNEGTDAAIRLLKEELGVESVTPMLSRIQDRVRQLAQDPNQESPYHGNPTAAGIAAAEEIAKSGEFKVENKGLLSVIPGMGTPTVTRTQRAGGAVKPTGAAAKTPSIGAAYVAPNGRAVTMDEITATAKARGMTPEQVIQRLQLKAPDA